MADRSGGNNYEDLRTGGNARVHAGSVYNNQQITNNVYNYFYVDASDPRLSPPPPPPPPQYISVPSDGQQPQLPADGRALPGPANVSSSNSQSSDSIRAENHCGRLTSAISGPSANVESACEIIEQPNRNESRHMYFLDGRDLATYVVMRYVKHWAGPHAEVRPYTFRRRDGYLVLGMPLEEGRVAELKKMSQRHYREKQLERQLF